MLTIMNNIKDMYNSIINPKYIITNFAILFYIYICDQIFIHSNELTYDGQFIIYIFIVLSNSIIIIAIIFKIIYHIIKISWPIIYVLFKIIHYIIVILIAVLYRPFSRLK